MFSIANFSITSGVSYDLAKNGNEFELAKVS